MRTLLALVVGLSTVLADLSFAEGIEIDDPERLGEISEWSELCEIADCDQFPVGYNTYVFGSEVYYFPTGRTMFMKADTRVRPVRRGGFVELGEDGELVRSVGLSGSLIISRCCTSLLAFYDLLDEIPRFRPHLMTGRPNMMPPARTSLSSYDRPVYQNELSWSSDYDGDVAPAMDSFLSDDQPSYNDDFWLRSIGDVDAKGRRAFGFLSKQPLLLGRHIRGGCQDTCSFSTVSFAETASEPRPHIVIRSVYVTDENMFLCSPEEFEAGCDPASRTMDKVKTLLLVLDKMFDAAQVFPEGKE